MLTSIVELFESIDTSLLKVQKFIVIIFGSFMAFALVAAIVFRLIFKNSFLGLEEIVLISALWFYMLGAAIAASEGSHLRAEIMPLIFKNARILAIIRLFISIFVVVVAGFMCSWCYDLLHWAVQKKTALPATRIPSYVPQSALFVSTVLFIFYFTRDVLKDTIALVKAYK